MATNIFNMIRNFGCSVRLLQQYPVNDVFVRCLCRSGAVLASLRRKSSARRSTLRHRQQQIASHGLNKLAVQMSMHNWTNIADSRKINLPLADCHGSFHGWRWRHRTMLGKRVHILCCHVVIHQKFRSNIDVTKNKTIDATKQEQLLL